MPPLARLGRLIAANCDSSFSSINGPRLEAPFLVKGKKNSATCLRTSTRACSSRARFSDYSSARDDCETMIYYGRLTGLNGVRMAVSGAGMTRPESVASRRTRVKAPFLGPDRREIGTRRSFGSSILSLRFSHMSSRATVGQLRTLGTLGAKTRWFHPVVRLAASRFPDSVRGLVTFNFGPDAAARVTGRGTGLLSMAGSLGSMSQPVSFAPVFQLQRRGFRISPKQNSALFSIFLVLQSADRVLFSSQSNSPTFEISPASHNPSSTRTRDPARYVTFNETTPPTRTRICAFTHRP